MGASISLIEFMPQSNGDFLTYSQSGDIAIWSNAEKKCMGVIAKLPYISQI